MMGKFVDNRIKSRFEGDFPIAAPENVNLMDVAPNQIASIAASLIPFLEHDDANRALMGSNMMRQAVPLVNPEAPIVGTGIEGDVIRDSRIQYAAEEDGVVEYADAERIVVNTIGMNTKSLLGLIMKSKPISCQNSIKPTKTPP
jgi:DNA-directed RNA polymerase subunit beta